MQVQVQVQAQAQVQVQLQVQVLKAREAAAVKVLDTLGADESLTVAGLFAGPAAT